MFANEPLILTFLIADRRAALLRAATPSRTTSTSDSRRLRRFVAAVTQRMRPDRSPKPGDQAHDTRDLVSALG